ncbi:SH3 domain-binding glutamic acid-rich protein isoform X2 [Dunckerocampus dactyliophorus]|uniref:SH3 domain-binding glutamic acid-rich protein isoform X2 n=1 Tax=Dunckerocampus dactyliophorus TaxID=161453 RepID=UPI002405BB8A|nr:SH3 domain-binding glutamic acid-rich protein isoform X2 [Dunckerocampus dactyliophorus]
MDSRMSLMSVPGGDIPPEIKLKLPPINNAKTRIHSSYSNSIKDLKNQNYDLKLQLIEVKTETKLLKKVQHRHTVALQNYQDTEDSISEVLTQNDNEVRDLQKLLCGTRTCRNNLAWKLQVTEKELTDVKDKIQLLQRRVVKEQTLPAKDELSRKLTEVSVQLQEKDRRIQDLEKCNKLLRGSLNRQAATEHKNITAARKTSYCLQTQVYELKKETRDIKRELEIHNIYAYRLNNQPKKKGKLNKMVQTDVVLSAPASKVDSLVKSVVSDLKEKPPVVSRPVISDRQVYQTTEPPLPVPVECPPVLEDTDKCAVPEDEQILSQPPVIEYIPQATEEKKSDMVALEQPEKREDQVVWIPTPPEHRGYPRSMSKMRRKYIFSPVIENLHKGRPAYSGVDMNEYRAFQRQKKVEVLSQTCSGSSPAWRSDYIVDSSACGDETPRPEAVSVVAHEVPDLPESNHSVSEIGA